MKFTEKLEIETYLKEPKKIIFDKICFYSEKIGEYIDSIDSKLQSQLKTLYFLDTSNINKIDQYDYSEMEYKNTYLLPIPFLFDMTLEYSILPFDFGELLNLKRTKGIIL